jgi:hypothetical protein
MTFSARSCWSAIIWCPTLSQQSGFPGSWLPAKLEGVERIVESQQPWGVGREAWLRNSEILALFDINCEALHTRTDWNPTIDPSLMR